MKKTILRTKPMECCISVREINQRNNLKKVVKETKSVVFKKESKAA